MENISITLFISLGCFYFSGNLVQNPSQRPSNKDSSCFIIQ